MSFGAVAVARLPLQRSILRVSAHDVHPHHSGGGGDWSGGGQTLAAARRLRSTYCAHAHGSVLLDQFLDADTLQAVVPTIGRLVSTPPRLRSWTTPTRSRR